MLKLKNDQTFTKADLDTLKPTTIRLAQIKKFVDIAFSEDVSTSYQCKGNEGHERIFGQAE